METGKAFALSVVGWPMGSGTGTSGVQVRVDFKL